MESKLLSWLSHRLKGEPVSLGYIIQCLATRSLSVAPEICSYRKLIWFPNAFLTCPKMTFSLPPLKRRRCQQPEDEPNPESRTLSRAEAAAEIAKLGSDALCLLSVVGTGWKGVCPCKAGGVMAESPALG